MRTHLILFTLVTLILGILIGASFGILIAPRSGLATRTILHIKTYQYQTNISSTQEKSSNELDRIGNQVKEWINNFVVQARNKLVKIGDQFTRSISLISMPFPTHK